MNLVFYASIKIAPSNAFALSNAAKVCQSNLSLAPNAFHNCWGICQPMVGDFDIFFFNLNHIVVILNQNSDHLERAAFPADPAVSPLFRCCDAPGSGASWGSNCTTVNASPLVKKLDFSLAALLFARFLSFFPDVRLSLSSRFSSRLASFSCARASAA